MHEFNYLRHGADLQNGRKALIMVHGRGGSAEDILSLTSYLHLPGFAVIAPHASNNTWYPHSFLFPPEKNEPSLSSALKVLGQSVELLNQHGIVNDKIFFLGFSQGACLTLEYVTRNAQKWGGIVAFTGGLIGDKLYHQNYRGDFDGTPVFIGTSDPDPHVPVDRVKETEATLKSLHARVNLKIYKNMGHTISQDEIEVVNTTIFDE